MESGITDPANPALALLAAFGRLARQAPARHVFVPLWSAYPAVGFGDRDGAADAALGSRRPDRRLGQGDHLADRLPAPDRRKRAPGPARAGPAARPPRGRGRDLAAADRRSRLPAALDALLRAPVLTPKALAATAQDRAADRDRAAARMQGKGVAREVTGR